MAHNIHTVIIKRDIDGDHKSGIETHATTTTTTATTTANGGASATVKMGSRRIFTPQFKIQVLDSYRNDDDCKGNQRATARKYGIHRRQIQKWLQCEINLRSSIVNNYTNTNKATTPSSSPTSLSGSATVIERDLVNVKSNGNRSVHVTTTTTTTTTPIAPPSHQHTNTDATQALSLDISRHSVALGDNSSNKYTSNYPVLSPVGAYTPVSYVQHRTLPSTGLPCSPIFSASNEHHHQQQHQYKMRDSTLLFNEQLYYESSSAIVVDNNTYTCNNFDYDSMNDSLYSPNYSPAIATPIDLTISNSVRSRDDGDGAISSATSISSLSPNPCVCLWQHHPDDSQQYVELSNVDNKAWDLSMSGRKRKHEANENGSEDSEDVKPTKIKKLFKPYLPTNHDEEETDSDEQSLVSAKQVDPIIWSNFANNCSPLSCYDDYLGHAYDNYGNNSKFMGSMPYHSYAFYNTSPHHLSSLSPVSGYESATSSYSSGSECGESIGLNNSTCTNHCTYELNLKVQAIEYNSHFYRSIGCAGS